MADKKPAEKLAIKPTVSAEKLQLLQKIYRIQQEVETLQKMHYNESQKYFFARESDFISTIKPLLNAEKLVMLPTSLSTKVRDTQFNNGSPAESVMVEMVYTIYDTETGESIAVPTSAGGKDQGDKAIAKALTMANKYFIAKTFQIETTTDDPENDKYNNEAQGKQPKKEPAAAPASVDPAEAFERASRLVKDIKTNTVAFKILEGVKSSKLYNDKQKEQLTLLLKQKIDEIDNPTA